MIVCTTARTESCSSERGCRMTSSNITGQFITSAMAKAFELTLAPDRRSRRLSSEPLRYRDLTKPRTLTYGRHSTDVICQVVWRLQKSAWRVYEPNGFRCVRNRETGRFNGQTF